MKRISRHLIEATLQKCFGPTVRLQRVVEGGIEGYRVVQRERGTTYVLAQCFSAAREDRARTAAVWAIKGAM